MSLFYLIIVGILLTRITQFIMILTGVPFYYYAVFLLGQISAIFDIYLGIIHCYNLSLLWVMLRKMRESLLNHAKVADNSVKSNIISIITRVIVVLLLTSTIIESVFVFLNAGIKQTLFLLSMFTALTFFIVLLSYFLVREIKFFGHADQSHVDERQAVVLTSVMFCSGFFFQIAKNATAFGIYIYDGKDNN